MTNSRLSLPHWTMSRSKLGLQLAWGAFLLLSSNAALAQSCPPGYFVVGGAGAYGCAPMSNGGSSAPQPRQYENEGVPTLHFSERAKGDTFIAVAWHHNANDVWAIWGNWSKEGATRRAVAACNKVMGGGCTLSNWAGNGAVVIARDENGSVVRTGVGVSTATARRDLMQVCIDEGKTCRITQGWETIPIDLAYSNDDPSQEYYPTSEQVKDTFTYIAWPKIIQPAWKNKSWLASGLGSREMEERVLQKCKDDTGTECIIGQTAKNGVVVAYLYGADAGFRSAASASEATAAINAKCTDKQVTCVIGKTYDSRTPRFAVIDDMHVDRDK